MEFSSYVAARRVRLVRTVVLLGCPPADAEDIVQSALLRCYRSWRRVSRADSPDAYVHRILVNVLNDARARRWKGELPTADLPEPVVGDADWATGIAVRRALAELRPVEREVLVLRFYADLSERDAAAALGVARHRQVQNQSRPRGPRTAHRELRCPLRSPSPQLATSSLGRPPRSRWPEPNLVPNCRITSPIAVRGPVSP